MINDHFPTVFGALVILAALVAPVAPANAAEAVPDPVAEREFGAKLLVCNTCHGENGVPEIATIPVIWGQQENYVVKPMHDFQNGARTFEVMSWMASTLSQAELGPQRLISRKEWRRGRPGRTTRSAPPLSPPATSPPAGAAVCQVCHQQNFVGGQLAPRLAGQSYEYLVEAMRRFADGERTNNAEMMKIMEATSLH